MKRLLIALAAVAVVIVILIGGLAFFLSDPERYRGTLIEIVETNTGYQLDFGAMAWRYWPPIALDIEDVVVRVPDSKRPLLKVKAASVDLALLPLITGSSTLGVSGLSLDRLRINAAVDEDGVPNWEVQPATTPGQAPLGKQSPDQPAGEKTTTPGDTTSSAPPASAPAEESAPIELAIDAIDISDIVINYADAGTREKVKLVLGELTTGETNVDTGTPMIARIESLVLKSASVDYSKVVNRRRTDSAVFSLAAIEADLIQVDSGTDLTATLRNVALSMLDATYKAGKTDVVVKLNTFNTASLNFNSAKDVRASLEDFLVEQLDASYVAAGDNIKAKVNRFETDKLNIESGDTLKADISQMMISALDAAYVSKGSGDDIQVKLADFETSDLHVISSDYNAADIGSLSVSKLNLNYANSKSTDAAVVSLDKLNHGKLVFNDGPESNIALDSLLISKLNADYKNKTSNMDYQLVLRELKTGRLVPVKPVDISADFDAADRIGKMDITSKVNGKLTVNQALTQIDLGNLTASSKIKVEGMPSLDANVKVTGVVNTEADTAKLGQLELAMGKLTLNASVDVSKMMTDNPTIKGRVNTNEFNANQLMKQLGMDPVVTTADYALNKVSFNATLDGSLEALAIPKLDATLDKTKISGSATIRPGNRTGINFNLALNKIQADDYLPPAEAPPASAKKSGSDNGGGATPPVGQPNENFEVIPVPLLKEYDVTGKLSISELGYSTFNFTDFVMNVTNQKNVLDTNIDLMGYGGKANFKLRSAYKAMPQTKTTLSISNMNLQELAETEMVTGSLNMDSNLTMKGRQMNQVVGSLNGKSLFTVTDGTLDVTSIKQMAAPIEQALGQDSGISSWPDRMPFKKLDGQHVFQKSQANQVLNFNLENIKVDGKGGFNYLANSMDYIIDVVMEDGDNPTFPVNPNLAGVEFPINCKGALDASPADICRPDNGAISSIVGDIIKNKAREKGKEKIQELINEKAGDELKGVLEGLFNR